MRGYNCYYYYKSKLEDGNFKLIQHFNTACWGGLHSFFPPIGEHGFVNTIYISHFDEENTKQYQNLLINTINKITPCKIVLTNYPIFRNENKLSLDSNRFIKYKLLSTYDKNLFLLNFVRTLWYTRFSSYAPAFFKSLKKTTKEYRDPVVQLTAANVEAIKTIKQIDTGFFYDGDHSNIYRKSKIKTTRQLLNFDGNNLKHFIT